MSVFPSLKSAIRYPLRPVHSTKVIIFYIVIQQIDSHLIMPQVMGAVISLHPVVIVIATRRQPQRGHSYQ